MLGSRLLYVATVLVVASLLLTGVLVSVTWVK